MLLHYCTHRCLIALILVTCAWIVLRPMTGGFAEDVASRLLALIAAFFFFAVMAGLVASLPKHILVQLFTVRGLLAMLAGVVIMIVVVIQEFPSDESGLEGHASIRVPQDMNEPDSGSVEKALSKRGDALIKRFHFDEWSEWTVSGPNSRAGIVQIPSDSANMKVLKLRAQLDDLKMAALREKAFALGVEADELESAEERGKAALVSLIVAKQRFQFLSK